MAREFIHTSVGSNTSVTYLMALRQQQQGCQTKDRLSPPKSKKGRMRVEATQPLLPIALHLRLPAYWKVISQYPVPK
jgi:hypothetical protein